MADSGARLPRVAIVGPCASGKSTLVRRLRAAGLDARMPAQEHSGVPDMWLKLLQPDLLVALDAANATLRQRRPSLTDDFLALERERLRHAVAHAHLKLDTSELTADDVYHSITTWLQDQGINLST